MNLDIVDREDKLFNLSEEIVAIIAQEQGLSRDKVNNWPENTHLGDQGRECYFKFKQLVIEFEGGRGSSLRYRQKGVV